MQSKEAVYRCSGSSEEDSTAAIPCGLEKWETGGIHGFDKSCHKLNGKGDYDG